jgi:hypothetical protein
MVLAGMLVKVDESPWQECLSWGLLEELEGLEEAPRRSHLQLMWLWSYRSRLLSKLRPLTDRRCEFIDVRV